MLKLRLPVLPFLSEDGFHRQDGLRLEIREVVGLGCAIDGGVERRDAAWGDIPPVATAVLSAVW